MKNNPFAILIIIISFSFTAFSQENIIKTSITGPFTGNFNLSYERIINEKNTLNFRIGYWKPIISPFISGNTFRPGQYTFQDGYGAMETSLEYRFYIGKSVSLNGFYIGPYLRNFNLAAAYTDEIQSDIFDVDAKVHTFGVGAQMGYQWIIKDIFSIDLSFFGAGIDLYNLKLVYTIPRQGFNYSTIVDDITKVFDDVSYFQKKLKNKVNPKNETTKLPFLFPGFRIGASIGVAF